MTKIIMKLIELNGCRCILADLIKILQPRVLVRALISLFVLAGLLAGLLVWTVAGWLPIVLPWALQPLDVEVGEVSRAEAGGWQVDSVVYSGAGVEVRVADLQLPPIRSYLVERLTGEYSPATRVNAGALAVVLADTATADEGATAAKGAAAAEAVAALAMARVRKVLARLTPWLPELSLAQFEVVNPAGERWVRFDDLLLQRWILTGAFASDVGDIRLEQIRAQIDPASEWTLAASIEPYAAMLQVVLAEKDDSLALRAELSGEPGRVVGAATFAGASWMPLEASVNSEQLNLPTDWFPALAKFTEPALRITALAWQWDGARYAGSFDLMGSAGLDVESATPVSGAIAFAGDWQQLLLEQVDLTSDWAKVHLSAPLTINLADRSTQSAASLLVEIDLSRQSMLAAAGQAFLQIKAQPPSGGQAASFDFDLRLEEFAYQKHTLGQLSAAGRLLGDALELDQLHWYGLSPAVEPLLAASGSVNLATRALAASVVLDADAAPLNALLGQALLVGRTQLQAALSGSLDEPLAKLAIARIEVDAPGVEPIIASGTLDYGAGERVAFAGELACAGAVITTQLTTVWDSAEVVVELERLQWADPERPELQLLAPTTISYQYGEAAMPMERRISVAPFHLQGADLEARGSLSPDAGARLVVKGVSLARIDRWLEADLPAYFIEAVDLQVTQWQPSIQGKAYVLAEEAISEQERLRLDLNAELDAVGVNVSSVELRFNEVSLLTGGLRAPVQVQLPSDERPSPLTWRADGRLEGSLAGETTQGFVRWLERNFEVLIGEGKVDFEVAGTLSQPEGRLSVAVESLVFQGEVAGHLIPQLDAIRLQASFAREVLALDSFQFLVNDSQVSGQLDLPTRALTVYFAAQIKNPTELLTEAAGELKLSNWQVADWEALLPAILRRSGSIDGRLKLEHDYQWTGELTLKDLALRPTQTMPSVDQIGGRLRLQNRVMHFEQASARMGGSPVVFDGKIDLSLLEEPVWFFSATGSNVPLVRTPDMILRSDVDLKIAQSSDGQPPLLSGALVLRSSTLLVEFDPLSPAVESGRSSRPPFFSISEEPFAGWRFDLSLQGDSFMRVRSPYFRTQLSADFKLSGTFAEPQLVGQARTVGGELRFPGAKMRLDQGEAFIEAGRLNDLQLNVSGIAQKANHVITMEVSQTLASPHIQFESTPDLSNAAILRLLATGSTQGGGVGSVGLYLGQGLLGAGGMDESLADKITVDVGAETTRSGKNTVGVRYDLLEDVYLNGEYDVFDAYNLDLVWSLFKR